MRSHVAFQFVLVVDLFHCCVDISLHVWKQLQDSLDSFVSFVEFSLDFDLEVDHILFDAFVQVTVSSLDERNDEINDLSPLLCMKPLLVVHSLVAFLFFESRVKNSQTNLD